MASFVDSRDKTSCKLDSSTTFASEAGGANVSLDVSPSKEDETDLICTQEPEPFIQVCGCLTAALTQLAVGSAFSYSGVTIPQLTSRSSPDLILDESSTAFFGSVVNVGAIPGSLLSGILMVAVGQRKTLLLTLPLSMLSWLAIAFANSVPFLLVARFFVGVTASMLEITPYSYVAEISSECYRGTLSGLIDVTRGIGIIFLFGIGVLELTWRQIALVVAIVSTLPAFIGLLFFHDSPRWLASRGKFEKSSKALQFFRGRHYNTDKEFADIIARAKESTPSENSAWNQLRHFADPSIRKRLVILSLLSVLWLWGGNDAITSYTATIFSETDSCSSPYACSILVGVGRTMGAILFLSTSDYIGRRLGFIIASIGCCACMFALGTYFYIETQLNYGEELLEAWFWVPKISILGYSVFMSSIMSIQSLYPCEILPLSFRQMGQSLSSIFTFSVAFSVSQTFLPLKNSLGLHGTFWLYALSSTLSCLVPLFLLPETRGKTLEDIENMYKGSKDVQ